MLPASSIKPVVEPENKESLTRAETAAMLEISQLKSEIKAKDIKIDDLIKEHQAEIENLKREH